MPHGPKKARDYGLLPAALTRCATMIKNFLTGQF